MVVGRNAEVFDPIHCILFYVLQEFELTSHSSSAIPQYPIAMFIVRKLVLNVTIAGILFRSRLTAMNELIDGETGKPIQNYRPTVF